MDLQKPHGKTEPQTAFKGHSVGSKSATSEFAASLKPQEHFNVVKTAEISK